MASLPLATLQSDVAGIFLAYFQRAPEYLAMQWYTDVYVRLLEAQGSHPAAHDAAYRQLSEHLYADGANAGEVPAGPDVSHAWYVEHLYHNLLGRAPDESGAAYWTAQLETGAISRGELTGVMLASAKADPRDGAYVGNRLEVALGFSAWQNSHATLLPELVYDAAAVLQGVDENPATVEQGLQRLHDGGPERGDSYWLTAGPDTLIGTARNDVFHAYAIDPPTGAPNVSTFTAGDVIDGGAGFDTLLLYANGDTGANASLPAGIRIRNIEAVNVIHEGEPARQLGDIGAYGDIQAFWQTGGAADVVRLPSHVLAGFRDFDALDATLLATGDADTIRLAFDNAGYHHGAEADPPKIHVRGEQLESVVLEGVLGGDQALLLEATVAAGLDTFYLNTSIATRLAPVADIGGNAVARVDASASSGDVTFLIRQAGTSSLGGGGDDIFDFGDGAPTPASQVDGGGGFNMVLLGESALQTQHYAALGQFRNIQAIGFSAEQVEFDAARLAQYDWLAFVDLDDDIDTTVDATVHHLGSHQTLLVSTHDTADVRLIEAAADVSVYLMRDSWLDLWLAADARGGVGATGGILTLSGDPGGDADYDNRWGWDYENDTWLELADGKFSVIDASGLDGNLTLWGMATGAAESVHLGAGEHNVIVLDVRDDGGPSSSLGRLDIIFGFQGEHTRLTGFESASQLASSPGSTLDEAFATAAARYQEAGTDVVYFHFGGDTYLYADTAGDARGAADADDFALKITGQHDIMPWLVG